MFDNTRRAFEKTKRDFLNFKFGFALATQLTYIAYLIYALCAGVGILWLNIVLLAVSLAYFLYFLLTREAKGREKSRESIRKSFAWLKICAKIFNLGVAVYSIYVAGTNVSVISVCLAGLTSAMVIFGIIFEILIEIIISKYQLLYEAITADISVARNVGGVAGSALGGIIDGAKQGGVKGAIKGGLVGAIKGVIRKNRDDDLITK